MEGEEFREAIDGIGLAKDLDMRVELMYRDVLRDVHDSMSSSAQKEVVVYLSAILALRGIFSKDKIPEDIHTWEQLFNQLMDLIDLPFASLLHQGSRLVLVWRVVL